MKCGQIALRFFVFLSISVFTAQVMAGPTIPVTFTVYKDFVDNNTFSVPVTLTCTDASIDQVTKPASESSPAVFNLEVLDPGNTCTATETVPPGYSGNDNDCSEIYVDGSEDESCVIVNTPNTATITVYKSFDDHNPAPVQVTLTCTAAVPAQATKPASEGSPAVFNLTQVAYNNVCSATELVPAGYTANEQNCSSVGGGSGPPLNSGGGIESNFGGGGKESPHITDSCTIYNTPDPATFTVYKDFSDNNPDPVQVTLSCTGATIDQATKPASQSAPAVFSLTDVYYDNTCTATESVPAGYEPNESDCAANPAGPGSGESCTIYNTSKTATYSVHKDFEDNNPAPVQVTLSCTDASIDQATRHASEANPAVFKLNDVAAGNECTATETVPDGYTVNESDCAGNDADPGSDVNCTMVNTPMPATFKVVKNFTDQSTASVQVHLSCTAATIDQATRTASVASPALFHLSDVYFDNKCTATETVPEGYTANESDCLAHVAEPDSSHSCTIINTPIAATFTVRKDFSDNSPAEVQVHLSCTDASIDQASKPASQASPAVFNLGLVAAGNVCTATETVPEGYTGDESDCVAKAAGPDSSNSCQIINTADPKAATFTVRKDFSDDNQASVQVTLNCTDASIDQASKPASEASAAVFNLSDVAAGNTCTATETVPDGYTPDESDCVAKAAGPESSNSCQIINTADPVATTFTVRKDFSDNNTASVQVTLDCTAAIIDQASKPASEARPAVFNLSNVVAGNVCTATEAVPEGYTANENDCVAKAAAPGSSNSCQIVNTLDSITATFTVRKDFSDDSEASVQVNLACTDASIDQASKPASEDSPAVFNLSGVTVNNVCTATEVVPDGYVADESDCVLRAAGPDTANSCQITNTVDSVAATFTVRKDFSDDNEAEVQVTLSCTDASIDQATKPASEASAAVFRLSGVASGNVCTATETVPEGYTADESDCAAQAAGPESSNTCQIVNTFVPPSGATFTVRKDFSDDNQASVQVTLNCTDASIDQATRPASESSPAVFNLSDVVAGNECTATETVPDGYTPDESDCAAQAAGPDSANSCQITNTYIPLPGATFTVRKDFSDDNQASVQVTLTCTSATIDQASKPASESSPAVFDLSDVVDGNVCTATEAVPDGYTPDESDCAAKAAGPDSANICQIINTYVPPPGTTFTVRKEFVNEDDNKSQVEVTLTCTDAMIDAASKPASQVSPAVFNLSEVGENNTCTATEAVPEGYKPDVSECVKIAVPPGSSNSCTIKNAKKLQNPFIDGHEPNQEEIGEVIFDTCSTDQDAPPNDKNDEDFQNLCTGLLVGGILNLQGVNEALKEATPDDAAAVRTSGIQTSNIQVTAVDGRIGTLRGGGGAGFSASGFNVNYGDLAMSGSLLKSFVSAFDQNNPAFMQANAIQKDDAGFMEDFGRWGAWVTGRIIFGKKDPTTNQVKYDFDTAGITFGLDYRFTEQFVAGVAVGYANTDADLGVNGGKIDTKGYSVSLYGTWFKSDRFYLGGSVGYGSNDYKQIRNVIYNIERPENINLPAYAFSVNQSLGADYDGSQFSIALSGGWDFYHEGWTFGPTFRLDYSKVNVDDYDEVLIRSNIAHAIATHGWAVHIDDQSYKSLQPAIGFAFSNTLSRSWGVFIPQGYIEIVSELKDGGILVTGNFLGDRLNNGNKFSLFTDDFKETFARAGLGFGVVLQNNKSAFLMFDADLGRDLLSTYYINAGFRWQF